MAQKQPVPRRQRPCWIEWRQSRRRLVVNVTYEQKVAQLVVVTMNRALAVLSTVNARPAALPDPKSHFPLLVCVFCCFLFLTAMASSSTIPSGASAAVLKPSDPIPEDAVTVVGPNFDDPISLQQLLDSYKRIGFQANSLGKAIDIVNKMVS